MTADSGCVKGIAQLGLEIVLSRVNNDTKKSRTGLGAWGICWVCRGVGRFLCF